MFCKCLWASLKTDDCLCPSQRVCIFINVQSKSNYSPYRCKLKPFALKCYCGLKYFQSLQRLIITLSGSAFGKLSMACWGFINSPARFPCGLFTINCVRTQTAANMAKKINKESGIRHKDMPINQISLSDVIQCPQQGHISHGNESTFPQFRSGLEGSEKYGWMSTNTEKWKINN